MKATNKQINFKLNNKLILLALLFSSSFICGTAYASNYLLTSDYEIRVHFTGEKPANTKTPFAKVIDNNTHSVKKTNSTFDIATDTLTIKGTLIHIKNEASTSREIVVPGSVSSYDDTVLIYGAKVNEYGLIVPIKIKADTHNFSSKDDPNDMRSVVLSGAYEYSLTYNDYFSTNISFPGKFNTYYTNFSCTGEIYHRTCTNSLAPVVVDVTLPYDNTKFYSPKKAVIKTKNEVVDYNTQN